MKKLSDLRQHLINALPTLQIEPERLLTFVDEGAIAFTRGQNYDHGYSYTATLIFTAWPDDTDAIIVPILYWLTRYQPDVAPEKAIRFEAEILANDEIDIIISIDLDERVKARTDCDSGRIEVEHLMPEYETAIQCPADLWQLYVWNHVTDDQYRLVATWPVNDE